MYTYIAVRLYRLYWLIPFELSLRYEAFSGLPSPQDEHKRSPSTALPLLIQR